MVPDHNTHSQLELGWKVLSIVNPMFGKQSLLNQPKAQCFETGHCRLSFLNLRTRSLTLILSTKSVLLTMLP